MKAELDKLNRKTIPPRGMLPISVPGCVDAWAELHKKFGKLKLSDDLAPAIRYAEEGFPVARIDRILLGIRIRALYKEFARRISGNVHTRWQRPHARERRHLQESGPRENVALDRRKRPGCVLQGRDRRQDRQVSCSRMAAFSAKPISRSTHRRGSNRSRRIIAVTMSSSFRQTVRASPALQMLNILEGFDLRAMGRNSPETLHAMIEAKKTGLG